MTKDMTLFDDFSQVLKYMYTKIQIEAANEICALWIEQYLFNFLSYRSPTTLRSPDIK